MSICSSGNNCNTNTGTCNNNAICEEGETQEGCATDCPYGCNRNGICDTENGEDNSNCPEDCKDENNGGEDFSTMYWTSGYNSAFTVQQGYGYLANWYSCLSDVESCWVSYCGAKFEDCLLSYPACAHEQCNRYRTEERTRCIDTTLMINNNIFNDQQAQFAYQNAQNQACGNVVRRVQESKPHRRLRS
jgi:hypothetical protein